jgi:hypothetical protein
MGISYYAHDPSARCAGPPLRGIREGEESASLINRNPR